MEWMEQRNRRHDGVWATRTWCCVLNGRASSARLGCLRKDLSWICRLLSLSWACR
jgi:hypothetical protein